MDRPTDYDTWPTNAKIKHLIEVEHYQDFQVRDELHLTITHICNIRRAGYPINKRNYRKAGNGQVSVTKEQRSAYNRFYHYNLTITEFNAMLEAQDHKCMICQDDLGPKPCVDHIPNTSPAIVRALLCYACNTALGKFRDSPELLKRAIRYINWHATKRPTCPAS